MCCSVLLCSALFLSEGVYESPLGWGWSPQPDANVDHICYKTSRHTTEILAVFKGLTDVFRCKRIWTLLTCLQWRKPVSWRDCSSMVVSVSSYWSYLWPVLELLETEISTRKQILYLSKTLFVIKGLCLLCLILDKDRTTWHWIKKP